MPEPVCGVPWVGLLAMQDGMPEATFWRWDLLRDFMRAIEARKVAPQPGECCIRSMRLRKQIGCFLLCQERCPLWRTLAGYQWDQTVSVLVECQNLRHTGPEDLGIEWQFLLSQNPVLVYSRISRVWPAVTVSPS